MSNQPRTRQLNVTRTNHQRNRSTSTSETTEDALRQQTRKRTALNLTIVTRPYVEPPQPPTNEATAPPSLKHLRLNSTTSSSNTTTSSSSPSHQLEEQQHLVSRSLDDTRNNIRKTTDEARSQIPRYTQVVNDCQEQTIQAVREIADNYVEAQKQIINSIQSAYTPYVENVNAAAAATPTNWTTLFSPRRMSEVYANIVSTFANNVITATRVTNNMIFANMEAFKTSLQQVKESAKDFSRIGVNSAKTFEQTSHENARVTGSANIL
jgi:hypothetical protein